MKSIYQTGFSYDLKSREVKDDCIQNLKHYLVIVLTLSGTKIF